MNPLGGDADSASHRIGALVHQLKRALAPSPEDLVGVDLTMRQMRALFTIAKHGPLSISDLAGRMGASLASTSSLAERLVKAGLIAREADPADRRKVLLVVSVRGQGIVDRLAQRAHDRIDRLVRAMTPAGREALEAGLTDLVRAAAEADSGEREANHGGAE